MRLSSSIAGLAPITRFYVCIWIWAVAGSIKLLARICSWSLWLVETCRSVFLSLTGCSVPLGSVCSPLWAASISSKDSGLQSYFIDNSTSGWISEDPHSHSVGLCLRILFLLVLNLMATTSTVTQPSFYEWNLWCCSAKSVSFCSCFVEVITDCSGFFLIQKSGQVLEDKTITLTGSPWKRQ